MSVFSDFKKFMICETVTEPYETPKLLDVNKQSNQKTNAQTNKQKQINIVLLTVMLLRFDNPSDQFFRYNFCVS